MLTSPRLPLRLLLVLTPALSSSAASWERELDLVPPPIAEARLGASVDLDGELLVVGAPPGDGLGPGFARVHGRDVGGLGQWGLVATLTPDDGLDGDAFGTSVALSGDRVVVGAPGQDEGGSNRGAVYVFGRDEGGAGAWGQVTKLQAADGEADDVLGGALDLDGTRLVVSALGDDDRGTNAGAVYLFEESGGGWTEVDKLTDDEGEFDDRFGFDLALEGDRLVVGIPFSDAAGVQSGSVLLLAEDDAGWSPLQRIEADDADSLDGFGQAVALQGGLLLVGAPGDEENGAFSGSAYVHRRFVDGEEEWTFVTKLLAPDGDGADRFGESVALSGTRAFVAAPADELDAPGSLAGRVTVFQQDAGGVGAWGLEAQLEPLAPSRFGTDLAASGGTLIVGGPRDDREAPNAGSVEVFGLVGDTCSPVDFDDLPTAWLLDDELAGVMVSGSSTPMIFDTASPTCADDDLATPGAGPGNVMGQGRVLILAEDSACAPDDARDGGVLRLDFATPRWVTEIGLLDVDEAGTVVRALNENGVVLVERDVTRQDDNGWQAIVLDRGGIAAIEIELAGSGAVTGLSCEGFRRGVILRPSPRPMLGSRLSSMGRLR
ncbi:MAG: hypothetical protein AAF533_06845 [Acidobacteriota bacterium]